MASSAQNGTNGHGGAAEPSSLRRPAEVRRLASVLVERARFAERNGLSFQGADGVFRRDLNLSLGYKKTLDVEDYRSRYQRGGIAKRLVALLPMETWAAEGIELVEDPDPGTTTAFEEAFADLAARLGLWSRLLRADILAGMGRYSAILIGAAEPRREGGGLEAPLPKLSKPDDILYLKPLAEDNAKVESLVKDPNDPRFGEPEFYTLQLGKGDTSSLRPAVGTEALLTKKAHWTRIIHVAEGLLEDDVYGEPRLQASWNYLDDLAKIVGGGAEATWKRLHPRTLFDLDPELGDLTPEAEAALVDEMEEIAHDLKEHAITRGITPHLLSHAVQNFGANADAVEKLIAATHAIPARILFGSERGELASSQDRDTFAELVSGRRMSVGTPIVRALVDRLVEYGALPEPAEYEVVWPEMDEMPESEKAEIVGKLASANQANVDAGGGLVITANEMRDGVLGLGPVEEIEDTGTEALDEPEDDADEPAVTVNASLRAAKLRLCAARGITFRRSEFDLADTPADEPEWKAVHRAADLHRDSLSRAVLGAWEDGGDAIDTGGLEAALGEIDAERLASTLAASLAGISPDSEDGDAARRTAINDALAAGRADRAVNLASAGVAVAEDRLAEILPDRLLATLIDGGLAALRSARSRGSFFRGAEAAAVEGLAGFSASFDTANPRAVEWATDRSSALITEIGPETLAAVRELIALGISEGIPPRKLAQQIRDAVGLRSDQMRAIENLRARMAAAKPGDLVKAGKTSIRIPRGGATDALIDQRSGEYAKRLKQQRALLVARTETLTASNRGQKELWLQAQDSGQLPDDIEREWIVTPDERLRPKHALLAGQRRKVNEPFQTAEGEEIEPGEEPACRCVAGLVRAQRRAAA